MANWTHTHYRKPTLHRKGGVVKGHQHRNYRIKEKAYKNKGIDLIDLLSLFYLLNEYSKEKSN
jgi:hypothetical protein